MGVKLNYHNSAQVLKNNLGNIDSLYDWNNKYTNMDYLGGSIDSPKSTFNFNNILSDEHMMGNITGLAGTLMQAAALPTMLKNARLQNEALAQNINFAKQDQEDHYQKKASFNNYKFNSPTTSAFVA